jgi:tetratricopeptide (TPR) repeat protein
MALEAFQRTGDVEGEIWAVSSLVFLCFQLGQDFRMMKKYAVWARKTARTHKSISPAALAFFVFVDGLSACYAEADPSRALRRWLASAKLAHQAGLSFLYVSSMSFAGCAAAFARGSRNSPVFFGKAAQAIAHASFDPVLRAQLLILRGTVHSMTGAYEEAIKDLSEGERICLEYGLIPFLDPLQTHLAHARLRLGDPGAWDALEAIHRRIATSSTNRGHEAYVFFIKAVHLLEGGEYPRALAEVNEGIRLLTECGYVLPRPLARMLVGVILREQGDLRGAERCLLSTLSEMGKGGYHRWPFEALLELAKLYIDCGKEDRAKRYLARALRMGREEGYQGTILVTASTKRRLVQKALEWDLEPEYVRFLQAHWNIAPTLPLKIHTLGRFEVLLQDRPIPLQAWHGRKTRDLLLILLSLGGKEVPKEKISDLLWPDAEGDLAVTNFHTTLHRLQGVLASPRIKNSKYVSLSSGYISINYMQCWSDCCAFEEEIRQAKRAESEAQRRAHFERARGLYQGEYLPGFEHPWVVSRRQDLHRQWLWAKEQLNTMVALGITKALISIDLMSGPADYLVSLL